MDMKRPLPIGYLVISLSLHLSLEVYFSCKNPLRNVWVGMSREMRKMAAVDSSEIFLVSFCG